MLQKHEHNFNRWELQNAGYGKAFISRTCICKKGQTVEYGNFDDMEDWLWQNVIGLHV